MRPKPCRYVYTEWSNGGSTGTTAVAQTISGRIGTDIMNPVGVDETRSILLALFLDGKDRHTQVNDGIKYAG